jgi:hypothetical protein
MLFNRDMDAIVGVGCWDLFVMFLRNGVNNNLVGFSGN